jgi:sugar phosphate isomerase/epimerase
MDIAMTTYGYLYRVSLDEAIAKIALAGYRQLEISMAQPHIRTTAVGPVEAHYLRKHIESCGLKCVTLNGAEINLISPNTDQREQAVTEYKAIVTLAARLGVHDVILVPGRLNPFVPMPIDLAEALLLEECDQLAEFASRHDVSLALETSVYGFMETSAAVTSIAEQIGRQNFGVTVDAANVFGREDPVQSLKTAQSHLKVAQISDRTKDKLQHTSIGRGEVDFSGFYQALREIGFDGPCVYEMMDGEDPDPRISEDRQKLSGWGWS